jgi:hypothetical protein
MRGGLGAASAGAQVCCGAADNSFMGRPVVLAQIDHPMTFIQSLTAPFRQMAYAVFRQDVRLRRDKGRLRVVLDEPKGSTRQRPPSRAEQKDRKESQELALMREQLATLLDQSPGTRSTMRHLEMVERALEKKGQRALHKLPLEVLEKALPQLEGMVTNWSPVGLAALRSKMAVAIIDREHMDPDAEADAYRTSAVHEPMPDAPQLPEVQQEADDEALAAAYAALGVAVSPVQVQVQVQTQGELSSPAAREVARAQGRAQAREQSRVQARGQSRGQSRDAPGMPGLEIRLLELHE